MRISGETLKAEVDALRKQAEPIWAATKDLEGRERHQRAFESSLVHFEQQRLCITVMGEFNTGKSTLLNTFIGEELLATDQLECTAVPTWVRWADDESYDENRQATVVYESGDSKAMPLSEVGAYTTLDQDSWEAIERVEIILSQPIDEEKRPTGFVLVDTPGLNGNPDLEARSIHQLGMSHVTIVVVPVDGVGRESDVELIKKARSVADRVMVVINKCDQQAKTGDGFEKFREELHRRIPDLPHEHIYTLSAKRVFEGNVYRDGEEELKNEFYRFRHDLINALKDPTAALRKRPLLLLREICKDEITRIEKLEAECDTGILKELEEEEEHLNEATASLQRSLEEVLQLARTTLMGEVSILEHFLKEEQLRVEREMKRFVDELDAKLIEQEDLKEAQKMVSKWLNESIQKSIFDRVSRLLRALAKRLIYDLENQGKVSELGLRGEVSIKLPLKQQVDKAREELSRREDEIDRLKREVKRAKKMRKEKAETLEKQSAQLEERSKRLETQRKKAVRDRTQLGPKPAPKVEYYTDYETKEVWRGGLGILDALLGPKTEKVPVKRQRKNYSRVEEWKRGFKAADKKVSDLDGQIKNLKAKRTELKEMEGELPKLKREVDKAESNLKRAEARFAEEEGRYRRAGIKTRQAQLKAGARRELESLFESIPDKLAQKAEELLKGISRDFSKHFNKAAARQRKSLEDKMARRKSEARAADAERAKREGVRKTLVEALETFLSKTKEA